MDKYKLLEVPSIFFKNKYFKVTPGEIRKFYNMMYGYINDSGFFITTLNEIHIEEIVKHHSGDCRVYYKNSGYDVLEGKYFIMDCQDKGLFIETIYDWMQEFIPSLWDKHIEFDAMQEFKKL